ncbi:YdaS family helix-turn-helix protein [Pseudomonas juntendi]|uniref:YdaS family helix-turn-helix protein n=1 Tax=Pseudomonas juntendi TaxID=2666183 RepID=UPI000FB57216
MLEIYQRLVEHFGGQDLTAAALKVNQSTVSGWVRGKHAMSAETAFLAQRKTCGAFSAIELRPSLAEVSPTLNETIRPTTTVHQSGNPSVHPSSTTQASP